MAFQPKFSEPDVSKTLSSPKSLKRCVMQEDKVTMTAMLITLLHTHHDVCRLLLFSASPLCLLETFNFGTRFVDCKHGSMYWTYGT